MSRLFFHENVLDCKILRNFKACRNEFSSRSKRETNRKKLPIFNFQTVLDRALDIFTTELIASVFIIRLHNVGKVTVRRKMFQ